MKKQEMDLSINYNRLPKRLKSLVGKARTVSIGYTDQSKLSAVARWKERMVRAGIKGYDLARHVGKSQAQLSVWMSFAKEPTDENFLLVERGLYELETKGE